MWIAGAFISDSSYPSSEIMYMHKGIIVRQWNPEGTCCDSVLFWSQALKGGERKQGTPQSESNHVWLIDVQQELHFPLIWEQGEWLQAWKQQRSFYDVPVTCGVDCQPQWSHPDHGECWSQRLSIPDEICPEELLYISLWSLFGTHPLTGYVWTSLFAG